MGGIVGFCEMFGFEYWCYVCFFCFLWLCGDILLEFDFELYEELDVVEFVDKVLLRFLWDLLWILVLLFIVIVGLLIDVVFEVVVDGRLCIDELGDGGDELFLIDNWVFEGVWGNNDDVFGLEIDLWWWVL